MTVQPDPKATATLADLLAAFLVALSGDDVVALHEAEAAMLQGYRLTSDDVPPIALLCEVAKRLRRCELAMPVVERNGRRSRGPDGHAFGAARLAIEMRLEQILEEMLRARPSGRPVSLADPADALAADLGKEAHHG